jgi:polar amino acid transport system substrate-binding protein
MAGAWWLVWMGLVVWTCASVARCDEITILGQFPEALSALDSRREWETAFFAAVDAVNADPTLMHGHALRGVAVRGVDGPGAAGSGAAAATTLRGDRPPWHTALDVCALVTTVQPALVIGPHDPTAAGLLAPPLTAVRLPMLTATPSHAAHSVAAGPASFPSSIGGLPAAHGTLAKALAEFCVAMRWDQLAVLVAADGSGEATVESAAFVLALASAGMPSTGVRAVHFDSGALNVSAALAEVRDTGVKVVAVFPEPGTGSRILRQAAAAEMLGAGGYVWLGLPALVEEATADDAALRVAMVGSIAVVPRVVRDTAAHARFIRAWSSLDATTNPGAGSATFASPRTPYVWDAVFVAARALDRVLRGEGVGSTGPGFEPFRAAANPCATAGLEPWRGGGELLATLREVAITGASGPLRFNHQTGTYADGIDFVNLQRCALRDARWVPIASVGSQEYNAAARKAATAMIRRGEGGGGGGGQGDGKDSLQESGGPTTIVTAPAPEPAPRTSSETAAVVSAALFNESDIEWPGGATVPPRGTTTARGGHFRVMVMAPVLPFVLEDASGSGNDRFSGYSIDVLREVAADAGFSFTISAVKGDNVGTSSLIDAVARGEADIALAAITITSTRMQIVDFTLPYFDLGLQLVVRRQIRARGQWLFMEPFTVGVWLAWCVVLFVATLLLYCIESGTHEELPSEQGVLTGMTTMLWITSSAWFRAQNFRPRTIAGKITSVGLLLVAFTFAVIYTASLASILSIRYAEPPVGGLDDVKSGALNPARVAVPPGTAIEEFFRKEVGDTFTPYFSSTRMGEMLAAGEIDAGINDAPILEYRVRTVWCDFEVVGDPFYMQGYGMAINPRLAIKDDLDRAILRLRERGNLEAARRRWFSINACIPVPADPQLDLGTLAGIFFVYLIFLGVAGLAHVYDVRTGRQIPQELSVAGSLAFISARIGETYARLRGVDRLRRIEARREVEARTTRKERRERVEGRTLLASPHLASRGGGELELDTSSASTSSAATTSAATTTSASSNRLAGDSVAAENLARGGAR